MLNNVINRLNDPRKMTKNFVFASVVFAILATSLITLGYAYPAGFAIVGSFYSLFGAAVNATIISTASGSSETTDGDITEAGSIS